MNVETPELNKMAAVQSRSQELSAFLDWLRLEKHIVLSVPHEHDVHCRDNHGYISCELKKAELVGSPLSSDQLLADYFGIDLQAAELERREVLATLLG